MQPRSRIPMAKTTKMIIRGSIYTFLQNYQHLTTAAAALAIPFSAAILLSQALVASSSSSSSSLSLLPAVHDRLKALFLAAGFPPSSEFFHILSLKLSQTVSSSILTLPFTLTFLLLAKATVIQVLKHHHSNKPRTTSSLLSICSPLFFTYICNSFLILSANATAFSLLFLAFNFLDGSGFSSPNWILFLSAAGAVLYSVVLANALIICNLALVVSGMESCGGYLAILKACVLMRGRTSVALSLALPANLVLAGIEALFHYRIVRVYHQGATAGPSLAFEGVFIAYLYSICVVLDTVISCMFYKSCKTGSWIDQESGVSYHHYQIEMAEEDQEWLVSSKICEEIA